MFQAKLLPKAFLSLGLVLVALWIGQWSRPAGAQALDPSAIQAAMQPMLQALDGSDYAAQVSWTEHLVLSYQLAQGRYPTRLEFYTLRALGDHTPLSRSAVLSIALRGEELAPTWTQLQTFVERVRLADWVVTPAVRQRAIELSQSTPAQIAAELNARLATQPAVTPQMPHSRPVWTANEEYNVYYGYLHAHSELSDGEGTPDEAYSYARDEGGLDFFSLTDHGELMQLWPWENRWEQLKAAAEAHYAPGEYVTLWGFEWSNPLLGHMNFLNTDDYTSFLTDFGLVDAFAWLAARPEGFGKFNHPGEYDLLWIEFFHFTRLFPEVWEQMVGIENWNGNNPFDDYYYSGSWNNDYSYWDVGNRRGWYLGAEGAQDNHSPNWGTRNDMRVGVLATELTREAIIDAYRQRRFFSTEDKDLELDFRSHGFPMGARLDSALPRVFEVSACDGSGDIFQEVRLYRNGDQIAVQAVDGNCVDASFSDTFSYPAYYYVMVRQTDDQDGNGRPDEAMSSPIWFEQP